MTNKEAINVLSANVMFACDMALFDISTKRCVEDALDMAIEALQKQKTGKWIRHPIYEGSDHYYYACSECDYRSWSTDNYCSVCGSKMEGEEDE